MLRDTAAKVALAEQIVSNFDRPKAEVIVEVTVLEVDRNDLRQLGILPPTGTSLTFQQNGQLPAGTQAQPSEMMINDRSAFSSNHFSVAIPQTLAQFLANSSHTKLLQNPTIRATDNQVASLRIGTREPVASGSFQNTAVAQQAVVQFQFVDVGVNLDITPRVMLNRDVSIQATIVVSALAGERIIGGVSQPRFSNRSITHEIRLMEGETNMLGGIMSESESLTESGIPWLKDLPGPFGYFFSQKRRQLDQTEIIIMLTPHIVRVPNVTAENMCGLITGVFAQPTFRGFEGDCGVPPRGVGIAVVPGAGGDKSSTVVVPGTAQRGNPPGTVIPPVTPNPADVTRTAPPTTNITFAPSTLTLSSDMPSNLNLNINGGPNLSGAELTFEYDPAAFSIVDAHEGGFLSVNTSTNVAVSVSVVQAIDTQKGIAKIRLERATGTASSPQGVLLTLAVKRGSKKGNSTIRLTEARLREGAAAAAGTAQTYQIFNKPTEAQVTVP
jgi:general secretion pathway protein D